MFSGRDGRCAYVSENWKGVKRVVRARMYACVCVCRRGARSSEGIWCDRNKGTIEVVRNG